MNLKPCPFCGGEVVLSERNETLNKTHTKAVCTRCGMHFSHTEYLVHSIFGRFLHTDSFEHTWNRRQRNERPYKP